MPDLEIVPRGPFSLDAAREFAGGFPAGIGGGGVGTASITLAFPVEGADTSVAAELWQDADGVVRGRTDAPDELVPALVRQASRSLSLDHDGTGWPRVGDRDPVIGGLQREHDFLRPVCFYSAYEAATSFVIGQRISRRQSAVIKARPVRQAGRPSDGRRRRGRRRSRARRGCSSSARRAGSTRRRSSGCTASRPAALEGRLDTESLRAMPEAEALAAAPDPARRGAVHRERRPVSRLRRRRRPARRRRARSRGRSGTCTGSRAPRARTWSGSPRRGGRTGCGRSCCCGWRGRGAAGPRSAIGGSAARPDGVGAPPRRSG